MSEQQKEILLVEDEAPVRDLLEKFLKESGYKTHTCENAHDACETLKEKNFELVITDLRMPKKDGYHLLQYLEERRAKQQATQKTLVITGSNQDEVIVKMEDQGLQGLFKLYKPFQKQEFLDAVKEALDYKVV